MMSDTEHLETLIDTLNEVSYWPLNYRGSFLTAVISDVHDVMHVILGGDSVSSGRWPNLNLSALSDEFYGASQQWPDIKRRLQETLDVAFQKARSKN